MRYRIYKFLAVLITLRFFFKWYYINYAGPSPLGQLTFSKAYTTQDGALLRLTTARDGRFRLWTPISNLPKHTTSLILKKEDDWFYWHPGVNPWPLFKGVIATTLNRNGKIPGGSTITMQLARLLWRLDTNTVEGKVDQVLRSLALEAKYSKTEILEAYLNLAPFGASIEGLGTASWVYFHKSPLDLSDAESLRLAIVPQDPVLRDLSRTRGLGISGKKSLRVLAIQMATTRKSVEDLFLNSTEVTGHSVSDLPFLAGHVIDHLESTLPAPAAYEDGRIVTTLHISAQRSLQKTLQNQVESLKIHGIQNAAALLVHAPTGLVLAALGSADYFNDDIDGRVDGLHAKRSPGSTLKPFIFAMAIEKGLINPMTTLFDVPARYGMYDPENFDRSYLGPLPATDALTRSRNIPAIALLKDVGLEDFIQRLKNSGMTISKPAQEIGLPVAVGAAEASLEELVSLYIALSQRGKTRAVTYHMQNTALPQEINFTTPEAASLVRSMLESQGRVDSIRVNAQTYDRNDSHGNTNFAWKTGTSFGFHDAWTLGTFDDFVLGVWVGDFRGQPNNALIGREIAAPLWFKIADVMRTNTSLNEHLASTRRQLQTKRKAEDKPLDIKAIRVCALSGDLPGPGCKTMASTYEIPGVSQRRFCTIHQQFEINKLTGLRRCPFNAQNQNYELKTFEAWPTNVQHLLRRIGMKTSPLPKFESGCEDFDGTLPQVRQDLASLEILSPLSNVEYRRPLNPKTTQDPILLQAKGAADSTAFFWFANNTYLGKLSATSQQGEQPHLKWDAKPGDYNLRVVDQKGRSTSMRLRVKAIM
jgi:penicillin-binding protein 1C